MATALACPVRVPGDDGGAAAAGAVGAGPGRASHPRDCHSAAPPSTFSRRFNSDVEGMSA